MLNNTKMILLNKLPLGMSWAQNGLTTHQGHLRKARQAKQIKSTHLHNKW